MYLLKKIKDIPKQLFSVLTAYPVELLLLLYCAVTFALYKEKVIEEPLFLVLVPIFLAISYALNNLFPSGRWRMVYWTGWLLMIPLSFAADWHQWADSNQFSVTILVLCPVVVLLCRKVVDNRQFVGDVLRYVCSLTMAGFLTQVGLGLFMAIFYSVVYIFQINNSSLTDSVIAYALIVSSLLIFPVVAFGFIRRSFSLDWQGSKFFDTLLNLIVTPALLIYTAILYLYIIKILVQWQLPQGGVAYQVFGFAIFAIVVKALQGFVSKRRYDWYFNYFSLISLPALLLFWIGVARRVGEYGLTESRVFLIVSGMVMTLCLAMFATKRLGRYAYVAAAAFVLFGAVVYTPYLYPQQIALRSQQDRMMSIARQLDLLGPDGRFLKEPRPQSDTVHREAYRRLYASLKYMEKKDPQVLSQVGLTATEDFVRIVPSEIESYVVYGTDGLDMLGNMVSVSDRLAGREISDISGYTKILIPGNTSKEIVYANYKDGELVVYENGEKRFGIDVPTFVNQCFSLSGYSLQQPPAKQTLDSMAGALLVYRNDSVLVKFSTIRFRYVGDAIEVSDAEVDFVLVK